MVNSIQKPIKIKQIFKFCPGCGCEGLDFDGYKRYSCSGCGFKYFQNAPAASGVFLRWQGKLVLIERGKNPAKGLLGVPGGFVDMGEKAEDGLRREVREEVGVEISEPVFLCNQVNRYTYAGIDYYTHDQYFVAEALSEPKVVDSGEVAAIEYWHAAEVDLSQIAFEPVRRALPVYIERFG